METIRKAYQNNDWDLVEQACQELFGMSIYEEEPKKKRGRPKKQPVEKAEVSMEIQEPIQVNKSSAENFIAPTRNNSTASRREGPLPSPDEEKIICAIEPIDTSKTKINTFIDDRRQFRDDIKVDKALAGHRSKRERDSFSEVPTKCVSCGRKAQVHPMFAASYRCDNCYK